MFKEQIEISTDFDEASPSITLYIGVMSPVADEETGFKNMMPRSAGNTWGRDVWSRRACWLNSFASCSCANGTIGFSPRAVSRPNFYSRITFE